MCGRRLWVQAVLNVILLFLSEHTIQLLIPHLVCIMETVQPGGLGMAETAVCKPSFGPQVCLRLSYFSVIKQQTKATCAIQFHRTEMAQRGSRQAGTCWSSSLELRKEAESKETPSNTLPPARPRLLILHKHSPTGNQVFSNA